MCRVFYFVPDECFGENEKNKIRFLRLESLNSIRINKYIIKSMADLFDIANLITTVCVDAVKIKPEPGLPEKSSNEILTELFSTFDADEGIVSPESGDEFSTEVKVKTEKSEKSKRKKSKKKHKHKDKKHKKKNKKNSSDSESEAEDGTKKRKKHKKKSKRRRESSSSKSSESDEHKSKIQKLDINDIQGNFNIGRKDIGNEFDIADRSNAEKTVSMFQENMVVKQEPGNKPKESRPEHERNYITQPPSPQLPFINDKIAEANLEDDIMPRLHETAKPSAPGKILIKDLKNSLIYSKVVKEVENKAREKAARMEDGELSDSSGNNRTPTLSPSPSRVDRLGTPSLSPESSRSNLRTPSPILRVQQLEKVPTNDLRMILKQKEKKRLEEISKSKFKNGKDRRDDKTQKEQNRKDLSHRDYGDRYNRRSGSHERKRSQSKTDSRSRRSRSSGKEKSREKSRDRRNREKSKDRWERERSRERRKASRDGEKDRYRSRSRDRSRDRRNNRGRTRSKERKERIEIDKKKLLEIARKNAINMIQQGTLPLAQQDKAIAAIQAGGKTVDELTDFCKSLSKSEALGELSSISSDDDGSSSEKGFHHPFLVKDRPNSIIMNIRDAKQLPTKTFQEKTAESSTQLRLQFPVSSGQHHRKTENEWVPVTPKKPETKKASIPITTPSEPLAIMPAPAPLPVPVPVPVPQPAVFSPAASLKNVDIGCIVSQRLAAMRKLRENPNDVQALTEMYRAQSGMKTWAESKQMPGQFTGSTGVKVLSASELAAGYQAWARKDQLLTAQPVSGGMGMALLQKMGWRPGEGLGKNKEGTLVPLQLEVKLDKRGLVSDQDIGQRVGKTVKPVVPTIKTLEGKHPVSLLGEYCSKRKFGAPVYELCFECGPDHRKNFLFKVKVNGIEYKPSVASPNKKQAKAEAAQICLQTLGLLAT